MGTSVAPGGELPRVADAGAAKVPVAIVVGPLGVPAQAGETGADHRVVVAFGEALGQVGLDPDEGSLGAVAQRVREVERVGGDVGARGVPHHGEKEVVGRGVRPAAVLAARRREERLDYGPDTEPAERALDGGGGRPRPGLDEEAQPGLALHLDSPLSAEHGRGRHHERRAGARRGAARAAAPVGAGRPAAPIHGSAVPRRRHGSYGGSAQARTAPREADGSSLESAGDSESAGAGGRPPCPRRRTGESIPQDTVRPRRGTGATVPVGGQRRRTASAADAAERGGSGTEALDRGDGTRGHPDLSRAGSERRRRSSPRPRRDRPPDELR
jgi:hypothetical protein